MADDAEATNSLIQARTHWQPACQVEFLLDWLEALVETGDDSTFGAVAAGLYTIAQRGGPVEDAERVFPVWSTDDEHSIYLAEWSIEEFGRRIEPRLRDIAQREHDLKIIPLVMQQWGLEP